MSLMNETFLERLNRQNKEEKQAMIDSHMKRHGSSREEAELALKKLLELTKPVFFVNGKEAK